MRAVCVVCVVWCVWCGVCVVLWCDVCGVVVCGVCVVCVVCVVWCVCCGWGKWCVTPHLLFCVGTRVYLPQQKGIAKPRKHKAQCPRGAGKGNRRVHDGSRREGRGCVTCEACVRSGGSLGCQERKHTYETDSRQKEKECGNDGGGGAWVAHAGAGRGGHVGCCIHPWRSSHNKAQP